MCGRSSLMMMFLRSSLMKISADVGAINELEAPNPHCQHGKSIGRRGLPNAHIVCVYSARMKYSASSATIVSSSKTTKARAGGSWQKVPVAEQRRSCGNSLKVLHLLPCSSRSLLRFFPPAITVVCLKSPAVKLLPSLFTSKFDGPGSYHGAYGRRLVGYLKAHCATVCDADPECVDWP